MISEAKLPLKTDDVASLEKKGLQPKRKAGWCGSLCENVDRSIVKVHLAFWLFGVFNHFGSIVILTGAHDISRGHDIADSGHNFTYHNYARHHRQYAHPHSRSHPHSHAHSHAHSHSHSHSQAVASAKNTTNLTRPCDALTCNRHSTAIILLANVVPGLVVKMIAPYFIHVLPYSARIGIMVLCTTASFLTVALFKQQMISLVGVVLMSVAFGFGELTFLGMTSYFPKSAVSYWASGTGFSGFAGSWLYVIMRRFMSPRDSHLACLVVPFLMVLTYWKVLEMPKHTNSGQSRVELRRVEDGNMEDADSQSIVSSDELIPANKASTTVVFDAEKDRKKNTNPDVLSFRAKVMHLPSLLQYMLPLFVVYYSEYLINQGLYELMIWRTCVFVDPSEQYRWFVALYQVGVFISRSSVQLFPIRHIWLLAGLQVVNLALCIGEVDKHIFPNIYVSFGIILFEGLLGGACYVNAFTNIHREVQPRFKEFSLSAASMADGVGTTLAGASALPIHAHYCHIGA